MKKTNKKIFPRVTAFFLAFATAFNSLGSAACATETWVPRHPNPAYAAIADDTWTDRVEKEAIRMKLVPTGISYEETSSSLTMPLHSGWGKRWLLDESKAKTAEVPTGSGGQVEVDFSNYAQQFITCMGGHKANIGIPIGGQAFAQTAYYPTDNINNYPKFIRNASGNDIQKAKFLLILCGISMASMKIPLGGLKDDSAYDEYSMIPFLIFRANDEGAAYGRAFDGSSAQADWEKIVRPGSGNVISAFEQEYNPNSYGSTAVWDALNGNGRVFFNECWEAAKFASNFTYANDGTIQGVQLPTETPQLESDGYYHMRYDYSGADAVSRKFFAKLYASQVSGDWQFMNENGAIDFKSPTGAIPDCGYAAKLAVPSDTEADRVAATSFSPSGLVSFKFYGFNVDEAKGSFDNSQVHFGSFPQKLELLVTPGTARPCDGGSFQVKVSRYKHTEGWNANYNVDVHKFDSETGKPLSGAAFDVLEAFDSSRLDSTDLDRQADHPGSYTDMTGSLNNTEWGDDSIGDNYSGETGVNESDSVRYNWSNDTGTQFTKWEGWDYGPGNTDGDAGDDPCGDDVNLTNEKGQLVYQNTFGEVSEDRAHKDVKSYTYTKGYCDGHPAPEIEYETIPEPEYDEAAINTNAEEIEAAGQRNQELHDRAWQQWLEEVKTCEQLAKEGGFFHSIEPDAAKKALEEDRDRFYKDFISLPYTYSVKETTARPGYIIHGSHTDDIPVEVKTVTSSEYKDLFGKKDGIIDHSDARLAPTGQADRRGTPSSADAANTVNQKETEETAKPDASQTGTPSQAKAAKNHTPEEKKKPAIPSGCSTPSNSQAASPSDADDREKQDFLESLFSGVRSFVRTAGTVAEGIREFGARSIRSLERLVSDGGYLRDTIALETSGANKTEPNDTGMTDHTFILFDHRTEGEIHINKRDLDLQAKETSRYDSYADSNGDGTLEGAVYGLFAKNDIVHPDSDKENADDLNTGIVYRKDDLVAVAVTDRDGNASFLTMTEAPGMTYHYETGRIEKRTDITWDGPSNLYTNESKADAKESSDISDNESYVGYDSHASKVTLRDSEAGDGTYYHKHSSNQSGIEGLEGSLATYPIQNNEDNNGNGWIGRPLFAEVHGTSYYVKELSRSEGYELSVGGKNNQLTNGKDNFNQTPVSAQITIGGLTYKSDTNAVNAEITGKNLEGDMTLRGVSLGEGAAFASVTTKMEEFHYKEPVVRETKTPVAGAGYVYKDQSRVKANIGDQVIFANGSTYTVKKVSKKEDGEIGVRPQNIYQMATPQVTTVNAADYDSFMEGYNRALKGVGFAEPSANAPWIRAELTGDTDTDWITDVVSCMTAHELLLFNRVRITDIVREGGKTYAVLRYDFCPDPAAGEIGNCVYSPDSGTLYVKKDGGSGYFVYVPYLKDSAGVIHCETGENGFISSAILKDQEITGLTVDYPDTLPETYELVTRQTPSYWIYDEAVGEQKIDPDGEPVFDTVRETVYEDRVGEREVEQSAALASSHEDGRYTVIIPKALFNQDGKVTLKIEDDGVSGTFVPIYAASRGSLVYIPAGESEASYVGDVTLSYPGQEQVMEDAGTGKAPVRVSERPVRQKVKIIKDIRTNEDGGYDNNTYDYEAVKKATNFRFKAYLKSNLERLYRDENGSVTWLDRNGNEISCEKMKNRAFPFVGLEANGEIVKTNVEKIFTKTDHDTASNVTGINANNILSDYKDPETADTNAAWKTPFITAIAPCGTSVFVNAALYSFRGHNTNTAEPPAIRDKQNKGYTRLLETVDKKVRSAQDSITVQEYNYDKFFDAMEAANVDKWDDHNQTYTSWKPLGNEVNRTEYAVRNAQASDMVRQFAITWYLDDEVAKLVSHNTQSEDEVKKDETDNHYTQEIYDEALYNALEKAYNYLKPFFAYDLDAIYAIPWDSAADGGADQDPDTLSADSDGGDYCYAVSSYLPYGTYVVTEQQPKYTGEDQAAFRDFINKHYKTDSPKEMMVPTLYGEGTNGSADTDAHYCYRADMPLTEQAKAGNYLIRFGEEWAESGGDQRQFVIRAHNHDGDFEVFKYGLEPDKLTGTICYDGGTYRYKGFGITQEPFDPLKDYYNPLHKVAGHPLTKEEGANENSHYYADDTNKGVRTANGTFYKDDAIEERYQYGSVSEQAGEAKNIPAGTVYKNVRAMQGVQTAYDGVYAPMLVPYSVLEPADEKRYSASDFSGYADGEYTNTFYCAKLRIEKIDSETHENLLHDGALFMIYKARRDDGTGDVKFYEKDTPITGTEEFLKAMNAADIRPLERDGKDGDGVYFGVAKAGTPVCAEADKITLSDDRGNDVGQFQAFSTINDVSMKKEDTNLAPNEYRRQATGYLQTPRPLGAGTYVLAEAPPRGYVRTKPIAVEIYSDKVTYYKEGNKDERVHAAVYEDTDGTEGDADRGVLAQIYVENIPIKLQVDKVKPSGKVTFRIGGRIEGSLTEIGGNPQLEYAYADGRYLGYAYVRGTLERLKALKDAGEDVEIVYENGQFAGYGYITRTRDTDDDANKYVAGATMTLFDAIELTPSGDTQDHAFEGLKINRNDTGNILNMYMEKGYAGKKTEMVKETDENGGDMLTDYVVGADQEGKPVTKKGYTWKEGTVFRPDTDILYYDLDSLSVTWTERADNKDVLFGWDKNHRKVAVSQIEADKQNQGKSDREPSIYAFKGGQAVFEFVGGDFTKIGYNPTGKMLEGNYARLKPADGTNRWKMGEGTTVYHLDRDGNRDAMVDPYTGMAYVLEPEFNKDGKHAADRVLVWPVNIAKDEYGNIMARDKIATSRIATAGENQDGYSEDAVIEPVNQDPDGQEIREDEKPAYSHRESGYINGTWNSDGGEKSHKETTENTNKKGRNMNGEVLVDGNSGNLLKYMSPVYDEHGLVLYYQRSDETYEKGTTLYDRNDDFVRYKDSDNLEEYNKAAYALNDHETLYDGVQDKEIQTQHRLYHRKGESYVLENTWQTSDKTPNDPFAGQETAGQADLIKRLPAGTYIMEELAPPAGRGYTKAVPTGITVEETAAVKEVSVTDDTTKTYIQKVDAPANDKVDVLDMDKKDKDGNYEKAGESENTSSEYGYAQVTGAEIALYPARYIVDLTRPEGYRLEKTSDQPFVFETTNSNADQIEEQTASWTTGSIPIYIEGIPAGYYILEETAVPDGFVKADPVYVHIVSDKEIQNFTMADDHTKVEIWKYKLAADKKETLAGAQFALYDGQLDEDGNVVMKDGVPQYDAGKMVDRWTSDDAADYVRSINLKDYPNTSGENRITGFTRDFENMYSHYGADGQGFCWSVERAAKRDNTDSGVWLLEDGSRVITDDGTVTFPAAMSREDREGFKAAYADMVGKKLVLKWASKRTAEVTEVDKTDAKSAGGMEQKYPAVATLKLTVQETGKTVLVNTGYNGKEFRYSYKFDYTKLPENSYANSWLTADGMHRLDYLPTGKKMVLVEEKAPTGFAQTAPRVIGVEDMTDVQLHEIVNEQDALLISKKSAITGKEFAGNRLALYRADDSGGLTKSDEYLMEEWVSGNDGVYTEDDLVNGLIPDGFKEGDLKPHYLYHLPDGRYFLVEAQADDYYTALEPMEINYAGGRQIQTAEAVNQPVRGRLVVSKTDESGEKLHGVVFELNAFDAGGKAVEGFPKQIADVDGVVTETGLPAGKARTDGTIIPYTYKLRELVPPEGYAVNNTVYRFRFDNGADSYTKDPTVQFALEEISVVNEKTNLYIEKKDLTNLNDAGTDGAFIDGAVMALYKVSSIADNGEYAYNPEDLFEQWTTSKAEGRHLLTGLAGGQSYVLTEQKAPAGYTLMKPVLITVSEDGRSISEISNNMSVVRAEKAQGDADNPDTDSIAAVTVKGRTVRRTEVAVLNESGVEVLRFAGTDGDHVIEKSDILRDGDVYTFEEHTLYSDGSDAVTARLTRRVRFGETGFVYRGRAAEAASLQVTDSGGNLLAEFSPTQEQTEKVIDNKINPENPIVTMKNRNGEAGEPLEADQAVINTITYYNPAPVKKNVEVEAVLDASASVLDPYGGKAAGNTIRWTIPDAAPYSQGSVSFAAAITDREADSAAVAVTVNVNGVSCGATKRVPIKESGRLTVFNELTGSGKDLHRMEESAYTVRLWDERGGELAGRYAYTGSRSGYLKSGDTLLLAGNEFLTIDPADFKNCTYEVTRAEDGKEITGHGARGTITEEGSGAWFTRTAADTSNRQTFVAGETYFLTETTDYSDNSRRTSNKFSFTLNDNASISTVGGYDRETKVSVTKTDLTDGNELPGNHLEIIDRNGNTVDSWVSGDKPHEITGLTPGESYTLRETCPKDGYGYAEDMVFTVNEDGTVDQIMMENKPTHIVVSKRDITNGEELPGAHLEIADRDGKAVEEWISGDRPHEIAGKLAADGFYTLREMIAADGFVIAREVPFHVSHDGTVDYVTMKDDTTKVRIYKNEFVTATESDADRGKPVIGSTLQILNEDKTPALYKGEEVMFTTAESFKLLEKVLVAGRTYWLHEVSPAPGYAYADDVKFTVSTDGSVDVVRMEDKPTEVSFSKKDITGEDEILGNHMQLVDENGAVLDRWISGDKPHVILGKLEADHEYRLVEESPAPGYSYARDVTFTVNHDGSPNRVEMRDEVTKVEIIKISAGSHKPLAGAEFELKDQAGTVIEKWISTGEPHKIYGKLVADAAYILHESQAPAGYEPMADSAIVVNHFGDLLTVTAENTESPGGHDDGGSDYFLRIRKLDEDGNGLAGAAFMAFDENGTALSVTSEANGTVFCISVKTPQTITVTEIGAPTGYGKLDGEYGIEIPESGGARLLNGDSRFYQDNGNSFVFCAVDEKLPPETPPDNPPDYPGKGRITASFDLSLHGLGKVKLDYGGSVIDLTVKTGDSFPLGFMLAVFTGALFGLLGVMAMYLKKKKCHNPKGRPPKGEASGFPGTAGLILLCVAAAGFAGAGRMETHAAEQEQSVSENRDIRYQEKTYLSDTDDPKKQKPGFEDSITADGTVYVLDSVDYKVESRKKAEDSAGNVRIVTSAPFTDDETNHVPEQEIKEGGTSYYLKSYETVDTTLDARKESVSDTITYSDIPVGSKIPKAARLSVKDSVTGENVEVQAPLSGAEYGQEHWIGGFEFPITVSKYGANVFDLNGREVSLSDNAPLKGYESDLLQMIGVSPEDYRIKTIRWDGGTYMADGVLCRKLKASGDMRVADCSATYKGVANLPQVNARAVQAVYSDRPAATASDAEGGYTYTMKATARYVINSEPLVQKTFSEHLVVLIVNLAAAAIMLLLLSVLIVWPARKRRKEKNRLLYMIGDGEEKGNTDRQ